MRRALERLFPPGSAWRLMGDLSLVLEGLADSLERVREFIRAAEAESIPYTATEMLAEWHEALGQHYDPTQPLDFQRRMLDAIWTAFGGVQLNQLNLQMHKELPQIDVTEIIDAGTSAVCGEAETGAAECASTLAGSEINPYQYLVSGTVENDAEAARAGNIIAHFAPLHLVPQSSIEILSASDIAECGLAVTGLVECGSTG